MIVLKTVFVIAALSSGCVARPRPPAPEAEKPTTLAVAVVAQDPRGVGIPGAIVGIGDLRGEGNGDGYHFFERVPVCESDACRLNVHVEAPGFVPYDGLYRTFPGMPDFQIRLQTFAPPLNSAGEYGRLRVDDGRFLQENGSVFRWRGCTDFLAFKRFRDHDDLTALLTERIAAGCNTLRVLGMIDSFAKFRPDGDGYYRDLAAFGALLASRGLRLEFVVFADAHIIMPDPRDQDEHVGRVIAALGAGAFVEVSNEPFKNIPGGGGRALELGRRIRARSPNVLVASGDYEVPTPTTTFPTLDYMTYHNPRKRDWVRTAKDAYELRDGWVNDDGSSWSGVGVPVILDEPMGAAEQDSPGTRSDNPEWFGQFGALSMLMGAGATFHSDDGILSRPWAPKQLAAARAFFAGQRWVPASAPFAPYQRGAAEGGAGIGNMPLQHFDDDDAHAHDGASRTFCRHADGFEWCVAAQPGPAWTARPLRGCRIVEQPARGLVKLACP
jgi:hypothetical protein